jgi:hypothetical protein
MLITVSTIGKLILIHVDLQHKDDVQKTVQDLQDKLLHMLPVTRKQIYREPPCVVTRAHDDMLYRTDLPLEANSR